MKRVFVLGVTLSLLIKKHIQTLEYFMVWVAYFEDNKDKILYIFRLSHRQ